ncbi:hypothetical protein CRUP_009080, partial [Coryphaenoides rupestris]
FSSPVRRTSLGNLLGDELRQFNALRRCRSPNLSRGARVQSLTPQLTAKREHGTSPATATATATDTDPAEAAAATTMAPGEPGGGEQKPTNLLIPTVTCFAPPDLSPRVVDGIEDNAPTFHFNVEHSGPMAGAPGGTPGSRVTSATLLLETEELTKELHHMMLLLQLQMTAHHHSPALSSHPHAVQTPHNPASGDHSVENISCLVHPSPHLVPGTHSEGLCQSQSPIFHTHPMDLAEARAWATPRLVPRVHGPQGTAVPVGHQPSLPVRDPSPGIPSWAGRL